MAVLNVENSFLTENRSVYAFLNQPGQGLYIPLYQRDYSWDSDNIEQLLEDLTRGIQRIALGEVYNNDNKEIRFLGTIITVIESNRQNIYPVDPQAVPSKIEKLIDGQQRISTIVLMATLLTKRLTEIRKKVKTNNPIYEQINEICDIWINQKLSKIFSFDLGRGEPRLKPKIVRGAKDYWTRNDDVETAYKSELSNYLGHFIQAFTDNTPFPCLSKDKYGNTLFYQNGKKIERWLKEVIAKSHEDNNEEEVASASDILKYLSEDLIWEFERPELKNIINEKNYTDKKSNSYIICELVQTLAVCHYLLDRCCFTIIQPTDDDWAFDMFQSLNATGTPLTAIETFKPTVVNTVDNEDGRQYKDSLSEFDFKKIEDFMTDANSAQQKNKRTNDFLTSFFIAYDGRTISTHFSYQRKALDVAYSALESFAQKELFIRKMGNYAEFYKNWLQYDGKGGNFPKTDNLSDGDIASMLILFLKSSNHKMAITVLASLYHNVINGEEANAIDDFMKVVKIIAAYYFLWRSAYPNAGLDATYRDFFKELSSSKKQPTVESVSRYFRNTLVNKDINTLDKWKTKSRNSLKCRVTSNEIIRLALLIAAHDTSADASCRGLMKIGRNSSCPYITLNNWLSPDLRTIEHIAPQTNTNNLWDENLYDPQTELFQTIGNLTLLPQDLNSSAGNRCWKEKFLYYKTVAEKDVDKVDEIETIAAQSGVTLNSNTVQLLKNSKYNQHIESITALSANDNWNKELVERRTDRILDIVWERIAKWIFD
jgi:uncharacterized protein with ParB-like and HNH nuclease domain